MVTSIYLSIKLTWPFILFPKMQREGICVCVCVEIWINEFSSNYNSHINVSFALLCTSQ